MVPSNPAQGHTESAPAIGEISHPADQIRSAVMAAIEAPDLDTKAMWWDRYRAARAEALASRGQRPSLLRVVRG